MYTIKLSEDQIKLLKEALLCAEVSRMQHGGGKNIELLHINIDEQIEKQDYLTN